MKRLITLAIMVAFILGTAGMAKAVQIQATGDWQMSGNYVKNPTFNKDAKIDPFQAWQRLRTAFHLVANENLKAVFRFHVENKWGAAGHQSGPSAKIDTGSDGIGYDLAYLDFMIPNTQINVKAGKQLLTLPNSIGSHILDDFAYSVVATIPFNEMIALAMGWARVSDLSANPYAFDDTHYSADEFDAFFAILPITMEGVQLNPFGVYARTGKYFGQQDSPVRPVGARSANWYWLGLNATVDLLDPVVFVGDFNWGGNSKTFRDGGDSSGWIAALGVQFRTDFVTPMVYGLYESGESRTSARGDRKSKVMPTISGDLYGISSFGFNGSNFRGQGRARVNAAQAGAAWGPTGKWGVGLKLLDISFVDKLSHEFQAGYYQGTNDRDTGLFTTRDKAWETNFNTTYQMYEQLAAILELGYMDVDIRNVDTDAAWKAAFGFRYRF